MKNLDIRLYGKTTIYFNGREINFPFMKALLLLIILSDKKSYSRKKLQLMLWYNKNEEKADRNLRNTIYVIKQNLGSNIIITEKNAKIRLNEDIQITNDINLINDIDYKSLNNFELENIYSYFSDDIFEDINFEYGESLDDYIRTIKTLYNENLYRKLSQIMDYFMEGTDFENAILTAKFMIKINEYNEKAYECLLTSYNQLGMVSNAIEISDKFSNIFGKDSKKIENIKIENEYYRDKQVVQILSEIMRFRENKKYKHIGIKGTGGSGKSEILNSIKSKSSNELIIINYNIPNGYIPSKYEVYNQIKDKMKNSFLLDSSYTYDIVAENQKIILIVDNLDLADIDSIEELFNFVIRSENRILLISTYSMDYNNKLHYFLNCLCIEGVFTFINLENLKFEDLKNLYSNLSNSEIEQLIQKSGGNPFLINYLMDKGISKEMYNAFMAVNLSCTSKNSIKILKLLSAIKNSMNLKTISEILNINIDDTVFEISNLINRGILVENINTDATSISFYNELQKEYIYSCIKNIEKEYIHQKIANYFENKLCNNYSIDNKYYTGIIYHLSLAKDTQKACIYKCRQFNEIYNISHEFFPIALDEEYSYSSSFNIKENLFIEQYENLLNEIESLNDKYSDNILKLKINMFFTYARFYKSIGEFEKVIEKLNEILVLSESLDYFKGIFKVHLQFIQYAINIHDMQMMAQHLLKLKNNYKELMDDIQYAIYLRFSGYYDILNHDFKDGIKKIDNAQDIFKNQKDLYKMKFNIAACTFIKGEEKFLQNKFDEAFDYYLEAISICHDTEVHPSLGLLFSRLGLVRLRQNSIDEATYYLEKALKQYGSIGFFWGKKELYKHLSEVYILKGDIQKHNYYKSIAI